MSQVVKYLPSQSPTALEKTKPVNNQTGEMSGTARRSSSRKSSGRQRTGSERRRDGTEGIQEEMTDSRKAERKAREKKSERNWKGGGQGSAKEFWLPQLARHSSAASLLQAVNPVMGQFSSLQELTSRLCRQQQDRWRGGGRERAGEERGRPERRSGRSLGGGDCQKRTGTYKKKQMKFSTEKPSNLQG